MRVVHIGDVAQVAPALVAALQGRIEAKMIPLPQPAATRRDVLKLAALPLRLAAAMKAARMGRTLHPDVAHVHWIPNGLVGPMLGCPWVLHVHGSDIRGINWQRRILYAPLIRLSSHVVVSTPDLLPLVPGSTWLPTPIPPIELRVPAEIGVLVNARASASKGSQTSFAALRLIHEEAPNLRLAAMDGPEFEDGPWERIAPTGKAGFHHLLASANVVIGQFKAGALGIADLEALALNRPLVTWVKEDLYPHSPPVLNARTPSEVASAVLSGRRPPGAAEWIHGTHGPHVVAELAMTLYSSITE